MRGLYISSGTLSFQDDLPEPQLARDEVLVRPILAGICNTDLELLAGYYGYEGVPGHEFVGEVVEGPDGWVGKRVVGEINVACGTCDFCRRGISTQCRNRRVLGIHDYQGVFADYFKLPTENLVPVPETVSDVQAVFVEPLAAACQVQELVHIHPTERVVVLGAGKLGLLTAQLVKLSVAELSVVARHVNQRALLEQWGISACTIEELAPASVDMVIDCTGNETGFSDALQIVKPRGTLVLKSTYSGSPRVDLSQVAVKEITIVGSRCGPFDAALRLLEGGLVDVEALVHHRLPFESALEAFALAKQPGVLKILLAFS